MRCVVVVQVNVQAGLDDSTTACVRRIVRAHGPLGLYRGMGLNFAKACPAVAVTFTVYEKAKEALGIG